MRICANIALLVVHIDSSEVCCGTLLELEIGRASSEVWGAYLGEYARLVSLQRYGMVDSGRVHSFFKGFRKFELNLK